MDKLEPRILQPDRTEPGSPLEDGLSWVCSAWPGPMNTPITNHLPHLHLEDTSVISQVPTWKLNFGAKPFDPLPNNGFLIVSLPNFEILTVSSLHPFFSHRKFKFSTKKTDLQWFSQNSNLAKTGHGLRRIDQKLLALNRICNSNPSSFHSFSSCQSIEWKILDISYDPCHLSTFAEDNSLIEVMQWLPNPMVPSKSTMDFQKWKGLKPHLAMEYPIPEVRFVFYRVPTFELRVANWFFLSMFLFIYQSTWLSFSCWKFEYLSPSSLLFRPTCWFYQWG